MSHGKKTFGENYFFETIPAVTGAAAVNSGWFPLGNLINFAVIVNTGVSDKPVDLLIEVAPNAAGSGNTTLYSATGFLSATDDGKFKVVDIDPETAVAGSTHARVTLTPGAGGTAAIVSATIIGTPRHLPHVSPNMLASVKPAVQNVFTPV